MRFNDGIYTCCNHTKFEHLAEQRPSRWQRRLGALVNVALIPYVLVRFPREAKHYVARSFEAVWRG